MEISGIKNRTSKGSWIAGLAGLAGLALMTGAACEKKQPDVPVSPEPKTASPMIFNEVAAQSGVDFRFEVAGTRPLGILQTIGNGCALFDYDNDGNLDLLLVSRKLMLLRGDGAGKFTDVTFSVLGKLDGHFLGVAVGDWNNDGFSDLYLTAYRGGALLQNQGGKTFANVTKAAGLPVVPWGTSATFFDADGDGKLDLYVCNYVDFGPQTKPQLCKDHEVMSACGPRFYDPLKGRLFLQSGGKYSDKTVAWGAEDVHGKGLGVAACDFDGSGRMSLAIANDEVPGDLLLNQGKIMKNVATGAGTAYDSEGAVHGGMGTDWGDFDNDGKLDLFVATYQNEIKCLYKNEGSGLFTESANSLGLGPAQPYVTFGSRFLDFDNDGWLDLAIANGHVQDNIQQIEKSASYKQPTQLFRSKSGQGFEDATVGLSGSVPIAGRGLATGDWDNDGRIDLVVIDSEGAPLLLHNVVGSPGNFLSLRLRGTKSNRDGYGAVVTASVGGKEVVRHCHADGSYLSSSDPRVHLGLGAEKTASVTVRWPSGKKESFSNLPAGKTTELTEGTGTPN
jgi:enediyne biosynthesis protein E4